MSDINLDFTVSNNSIDFTVQPNEITITPTDVQLSIYTSSPGVAAGLNTQLQYNNVGQFGGIPNVTWNGSKLSLGNVANVLLTGGTNGYVLQTDGTGNLSWTAQTGGGGGNGIPGGANTQIQYNDSGNFGGNAGFTFDEVSGNVNIPTNLILTGNIYGNVVGNLAGTSSNANYAAEALVAYTIVNNAQPNITSTGTLVSLSVAGDLSTTGTTSIQQAKEKVTLVNTAGTGTINYDLLDQAIIYNTATSTGNITLNLRGNSSVTANSILSTGNSAIITYVLTTGATAHSITALSIDGTNQTIKWAGNTVPTTTTYIAMSYVFNIIKTANAPSYTVFASATRYG